MTVKQNSDLQQRRTVVVDGILNFRDLGGYRTEDGREVQWGKVYRSAQLDRLSEQGVAELSAMNIQVVIDLRFADETSRYPTMRQAVPAADIIAWEDLEAVDTGAPHKIQRAWRDSLASNDPNQVREAMRVNYPGKLYSHRAIYREMLLRLIDGQTPLMFHCAAGKDRTGVAAALLLSLLGVNESQIIEDYLLTQQVVEQLMGAWNAGGATGPESQEDFQSKLAQHPRELIQPVFDADQSYINTLLDYVSSTYGSFRQYAQHKLELNDRHIEQLQSELLSPS